MTLIMQISIQLAHKYAGTCMESFSKEIQETGGSLYNSLHIILYYLGFFFKKKNKTTFYFILEYSLLTREGNGTPLQYSCLENPMDRGAW